MKNLWEELNEKIPFYYKDIIDEYSLTALKLNNIETVLIKENSYGLKISIDQFNANISYITRNKDNELIQLDCNNYLSQKFDQKDREGIIAGETAKESIINDFIITDRGLQSKFCSLLQGNKSWINDFEKSIWFDGEKSLSKSNKEKIESFL